MSYILEALRKSEQERARGTVPGLSSLQAPPLAAQHRAARWPYLIFAALLANAAVLLAWQRPWQTGPQALVRADAALPATPAQPETRALAAKEPAPEAAAFDPPKPATRRAEAPRPRSAASKKPPAPAAPRREPVPVQPAVASPAKVSTLEPAPAEPGQSVVNLSELPPEIQQEIPRLTVSVHMHSRDPSQRIAGINERVLHEGEEVAPGLRLEQITRDGLVLSYKGYRFKRGVF